MQTCMVIAAPPMPPGALSWDDYRFVLALSRAHSLAAAARELRVDQSTVGRRISALERATGARLFDRTPEGWALTAAGESVSRHIQDIETSSHSIARQLSGQDTRLEGTVRLATSDSFVVWFLIARLGPLRARHPAIALEIVTGNQVVCLDRREADLSLRFSKPREPHLIARRLARAAWGLYTSGAYRSRPGGQDVVGLGDDLRGTVGWKWMQEHPEAGRPVLTTNSMLVSAAAVVAGVGMGPLPCLYGDTHPDLHRAQARPIGHQEIWLAVHPDVRSSARVRAVIDGLVSIIRQDAALVEGRRPLVTRRPLAPSRRERRSD